MLMGAHVCLTASSYVVAVLLARGLGPPGYGVYGIIYSVLLGVELIGRLGIPQAVSKLVAEREGDSRGIEAAGITSTSLLYLVIFTAFWLLSEQLASLFQVEDGGALFRIAALDIPFYGLYFICSHILNGRRNFAAESVGLIVYSVARVVGITLLLGTGISVAGALLVNVAASVLGLTFVATLVGRQSFHPTVRDHRPILALAVPIGLFALGSQGLLSMDLWVLNALGSGVAPETKGLYVAAMNLARIPNIMAFVASAVLIPSVSRAFAQKDFAVARQTTRNSVRVLLIAIVPICGLIAVRAASVMELVFSESYRGGAGFLSVLVVAHGFCFTASMVFSGILIASGHARQAATLSLALLPLSMIFCAVLVVLKGAEGAALAALSATSLGAFLAGGMVHRWVTPIFFPGVYVRIIAASLLICVLAALVPLEGIWFAAAMVGVGVVYLAVLPVFGLLSREDLQPFLPERFRSREPSPTDPR